jgi:hypothetical protein
VDRARWLRERDHAIPAMIVEPGVEILFPAFVQERRNLTKTMVMIASGPFFGTGHHLSEVAEDVESSRIRCQMYSSSSASRPSLR